MFEQYASNDSDHTKALHEALTAVRLEHEAQYYADRIREVLLNETGVKLMKLTPEEYKMLEFRRKPERLIHVKPEDISHLIDIALDTRDYAWVAKLQKQQELMRGGTA